jgi:uncharacterized protein (TIGR03000 family)
MASRLTRVLTALGAVAALALVGPQAARAQFSYPNGYDPESGQTWNRDFRYNAVTNPYGYRGAEWAAWSNTSGPGRYSYSSYSFPAVPVLTAPPPDNLARVRVVVPADAKVSFDGKATRQTGTVRHYESPALTPGHDYSYEIKATWSENGKEVTRTRKVDVRANSRVTVNLTPAGSGS